jgi:MFS transporter, DHA1 family, inner membrane transport protein
MPGRLVLSLCLLAVAATSHTQSFGLVFARAAESLGLTLPQLGGLRTIENASSILVALAVAPLLDRVPRKWTLLLGFCLGVGGVIALVGLGSTTGVVIFFAANGAAIMLVFGSLMALPGDFVGGRALNRVMGLVIGSLAFTSIVIIPIVGRVADARGWHMGMLVSASVGVIALLVTLLLIPRYRLSESPTTSLGFVARYRAIGGNAPLLMMLSTALFRFAQFGAIMTFLSSVLIRRYDLPLSTIGLIFAMNGIVFFVCSASSGALLHVLRTRRVLGHGGLAAGSLAVLALVFDPGVAGTVTCVVAIVGIFAAQENASTIAILRLAPDQRGAAMSWNELVAGAGALIGIGAASIGFQLAAVAGIGVVLATLAVAGGIGSYLVLGRAGDLDRGDVELTPAPLRQP